MHVHALKTHAIGVGESLFAILDDTLPSLKEGTVVAVTSKIISLCQGRVVAKKDVSSKKELIVQEAEAYLDVDPSQHNFHLTITHGVLIPSAGIDESNGDDVYILYPKHLFQTAEDICHHLRQKHSLKHLGVIITDSHTTPLRRGVTGLGLSFSGFLPLYNYQGQLDIFKRPLRVTQTNIVDALAASAVFMMGEGAEQTPLAILHDIPRITFLERPLTMVEKKSISIPVDEDLYGPFLKNPQWVWKRGRPQSTRSGVFCRQKHP